jgi:hypothetical protein
MSSNTRRNSRRCRAIIVATDGKRYLTRWRQDKTMDELGPDEFPPISKAIKEAKRYAERKSIDVKSIDAQFARPRETTP